MGLRIYRSELICSLADTHDAAIRRAAAMPTALNVPMERGAMTVPLKRDRPGLYLPQDGAIALAMLFGVWTVVLAVPVRVPVTGLRSRVLGTGLRSMHPVRWVFPSGADNVAVAQSRCACDYDFA
jgi:hypothetical protein